MKAIALILAMLPAPVLALDAWVTSGFISIHDGEGFNERNDGFGAELGLTPDWSITAGQYQNSMYRESRYAAATWLPLHMGRRLHAGIVMGAVSGYTSSEFAPLVLPALEVESQYLGISLVAVPFADEKASAVAIRFKVRLH